MTWTMRIRYGDCGPRAPNRQWLVCAAPVVVMVVVASAAVLVLVAVARVIFVCACRIMCFACLDPFEHICVCLRVRRDVRQADLTNEGAEQTYVKFHRVSEFASPTASGTPATATTPTHKRAASGKSPAAVSVARLPDEP
jgi:hypothetical protein